MMKSSERLVFYPCYCLRCFEHLLMKSLRDPCPICGKNDRIRHSIKNEDREDLMETPPEKTPAEIRKEFEQSMAILQEVLVTLRVTVKYMAFDLESTRRELVAAQEENAVLRKELAAYERGDK